MTMEYTLVVSSCPCRCLYRLLAYIDMYYSTENSSSSSPSLSILGGWRRDTPVTEYVCTKSKVWSTPSQVTSEVVCSEHAAEPSIGLNAYQKQDGSEQATGTFPKRDMTRNGLGDIFL